MIIPSNLILLLRLLIAHILTDFFFQRTKWIKNKRNGLRSSYLYIHALISGVLTYLLMAQWTVWQLPVFILLTHFIIDWWKSNRRDNLRYFLIDQFLHLLMIFIGWGWYIHFEVSHAIHWLGSLHSLSFWVIVSSYLLVGRPVGFLIDKATDRWQKELDETPTDLKGLTKAGKWIGYLERIIILTFFLIGQYSAVGFLIAAKSIFRISRQGDNKFFLKQAEYILIGTFMSFFIAVVIGLLARYLLHLG